MKKYIAILKASLQSVVAYRGAAFVWVAVQFLELIFLLLIYNVLFEEKTYIGGFTKDAMVAYLLMMGILTKLVLWFPIFMIEEDIRKGDLSNALLKPYSYKLYVFFREFAWRIQFFIISIPFVVVYFLVAKDSLSISFGVLKAVLFTVSIIFGIATMYLLSQLFGFLSFWLTRVRDFNNILFVLINFFGGGVIPIALLPKGLLKIAELLPTRSIISLPLEILFDRLELAGVMKTMTVSILWIAVLLWVNSVVWRRGVKSYEAYGR